MDKLRHISLEEYCPKQKRPLDVREMIIKNVQKEAALNSNWAPIIIPKMVYPTSGLPTTTSKWAFFFQLWP